MKLINAYANLTRPALERWSISGGGQGYQEVEIKGGESTQSLKKFLEL